MTDPATGRLVVVAPPAVEAEPSPRALAVVGGADLVCWEDTPRAVRLLEDAAPPAARRQRVDETTDPAGPTARVAGGDTVALIADAGTPGTSAATARLVAAVVDADLLIEVVPVAVDAVAALVASGLATEHVAVEAPLPPAGPARSARLADLAGARRTTAIPVLADLAATLEEIAATCGADRPLAVAGAGEEIWRGTAAGAAAWAVARERDDAAVVVVGGAEGEDDPPDQGDDAVRAALREARARGLSPGRAAAEVAAARGRPRREVYALGAEDEA